MLSVSVLHALSKYLQRLLVFYPVIMLRARSQLSKMSRILAHATQCQIACTIMFCPSCVQRPGSLSLSSVNSPLSYTFDHRNLVYLAQMCWYGPSVCTFKSLFLNDRYFCKFLLFDILLMCSVIETSYCAHLYICSLPTYTWRVGSLLPIFHIKKIHATFFCGIYMGRIWDIKPWFLSRPYLRYLFNSK